MKTIQIRPPDISKAWHQYSAHERKITNAHDILDDKERSILFAAGACGPIRKHAEANGRLACQAPRLGAFIAELLVASVAHFACEDGSHLRCPAGDNACPTCQAYHEGVELLRTAGYTITQ